MRYLAGFAALAGDALCVMGRGGAHGDDLAELVDDFLAVGGQPVRGRRRPAQVYAIEHRHNLHLVH